MAEKKGAYETTATDTNFRRKWDKEEYAEKARQKDEDERLRMQENDERLKQGLFRPSIHHIHYIKVYLCQNNLHTNAVQGRNHERGEKWTYLPQPNQ